MGVSLETPECFRAPNNPVAPPYRSLDAPANGAEGSLPSPFLASISSAILAGQSSRKCQ